MLSSIFGTIGGFIGKFLGGGILSSSGRFIGKWLGNSLEDHDKIREYYRIGKTRDIFFPVSCAAGKTIPLVFGTSRVNGDLIWSTEIKEIPIKNTNVKNFKTHTAIYNKIDFLYFCSFAIGICEGEIDYISRIWINNELADLSVYKYHIYTGSNEQMPDPLIVLSQTSGFAPAFRSLAYIVFENFPLAEFGNSIPIFSFEVTRNFSNKKAFSSVESKILGVNIIPGSGEFVYDTIIQNKRIFTGPFEISNKPINSNNRDSVADSIYSLNYLQKICPNVSWVAPVVCWFANSLDIGICDIYPAVEYKCSSDVFSEEWKVASFNRCSAREISRDKVGRPNYGGSINDASIVRYLDEIKSRDIKIMFYPMMLLDIPGKPWRGHITGDVSQIYSFFNKPLGYNNFILHYAHLVKGKVDAFIIGSELKSITSIRDQEIFPAVRELCNLASQVKAIVGASVKVSYAADWSEYHHTEGGWYHLDELWAHKDIDFIGIDNYMPVTLTESKSPNLDEIKAGFGSGEGYDYYLDGNKKMPLAKEYAWKNLRWWAENFHVNPNGQRSPWIPNSKKIWFTEYGFPSIDKATNQSNIFFDPRCHDGGIPKYSNGNTDFSIQRIAIDSFVNYWNSEEYVENMFLWCFDARPYPAWPHSKIWKDYYLWEKGHWINGKFGLQTLANIISDISERSNIEQNSIDVSQLEEQVYSFAIIKSVTGFELINLLRSFYFFDIRDRATYGIEFIKRNLLCCNEVDGKDFIKLSDDKIYAIANIALSSKIYHISIKYASIEESYSEASQQVLNEDVRKKSSKFVNVPFVMSIEEARKIAKILIDHSDSEKAEIQLKLPITYLGIGPCDIIKFTIDNLFVELRIIQIKLKKWEIEVIGITEIPIDIDLNFSYVSVENKEDIGGVFKQVILPKNFIYDELSEGNYIYFVNSFVNRRGLYISSNKVEYIKIADVSGGCSAGIVNSILIEESVSQFLIDEISYIDVCIVKNSPIISGRSLWNCNSLIKYGEGVIYAGVVEMMIGDIYRLKKLIFIPKEDSQDLILPRVGDEVVFLDKMLALLCADTVREAELYYKTHEGEETISL